MWMLFVSMRHRRPPPPHVLLRAQAIHVAFVQTAGTTVMIEPIVITKEIK